MHFWIQYNKLQSTNPNYELVLVKTDKDTVRHDTGVPATGPISWRVDGDVIEFFANSLPLASYKKASCYVFPFTTGKQYTDRLEPIPEGDERVEVLSSIAWLLEPVAPEAHPNDTQVGGDHYKGAEFQPWDWQLYGVGGWEQSIVKYVVRFKDKNGKQDLDKAQHYLDKAIFHAQKAQVHNSGSASLSKVAQFCDENQCNATQRRAIEFTILWKHSDDLKNARRYVSELMQQLADAEDEDLELLNQLAASDE